MTTNKLDSFSATDIRKLRENYHKEYTDKNGNFDWDRATADGEKKAATVRADIARIRAEQKISVK